MRIRTNLYGKGYLLEVRVAKNKDNNDWMGDILIAVFDIDGGFPLHVVGKVKPFVDVWYDGCDDPMDELTVEEFRKI